MCACVTNTLRNSTRRHNIEQKGHVQGVAGDGQGVLGKRRRRAQGQRAGSPVEPGRCTKGSVSQVSTAGMRCPGREDSERFDQDTKNPKLFIFLLVAALL